MAEVKQLIVVVETTAAMAPYWSTILSDYLEKIIRSFTGNEATGQKLVGPIPEFALVMFSAHGPCSCFKVQRMGWTRDVERFLQWLTNLPFCSAKNGFGDACIAEGLSNAIMMLHDPDSSATVTGEVSKHCVLACANNPYVPPTLVYLPSVEKNENGETIQPSFLADAEAVAKCFSQCSISLSVISPNQLPKLRDIYNAGKRGARPADPSVDKVKHAQHLLLLSDSFLEARSALNCPISAHLVPNPGVVKLEEPTTAPVSVPVTGSTLQNSSKSGGNMIGGGIGSGPGSVIPTPGMTQQSGGVNPMGMGSNSGMNTAQGSQSKYVKIWKGTLFGQRQGQPVFICRLKGYRPASASDTLAADWPSTMQIVRLIAQEHMNNKLYVGKADFLVFRTLNQHGFLEKIQEKKLCAVIQLPSQTLLLSVNFSAKAGRLIGMLYPGDMVVFERHNEQKYFKMWEGYREASTSDTLAADWPSTMQIIRLIAEEHMNNKQYVGKVDFLPFRTLNQHGFLRHMQEKKLCAVIQLPSQTLLLSVSDKEEGRLIGMLIPREESSFTSYCTDAHS